MASSPNLSLFFKMEPFFPKWRLLEIELFSKWRLFFQTGDFFQMRLFSTVEIFFNNKYFFQGLLSKKWRLFSVSEHKETVDHFGYFRALIWAFLAFPGSWKNKEPFWRFRLLIMPCRGKNRCLKSSLFGGFRLLILVNLTRLLNWTKNGILRSLKVCIFGTYRSMDIIT